MIVGHSVQRQSLMMWPKQRAASRACQGHKTASLIVRRLLGHSEGLYKVREHVEGSCRPSSRWGTQPAGPDGWAEASCGG